MQVGSKVSLLPKSNGARGSLPFRAAGVLAPHNRKERTMTGVIFLLAVSALLGGSLVMSSDA